MWKPRPLFFLVLCALGFLALIWSANDYFALMRGDRLGASFCSINAYWNCDLASISPLGSFHGMPIGIFGAAWFFVVAVLGFSQPSVRIALKPLLIMGLGCVMILAGFLLFRLRAGCLICYFSYICLVGVVYLAWKPFDQELKTKTSVFSLVGGLLVLALFGIWGKASLEGKINEEEFQKWFQRTEPVPTTSKLRKGNPDGKIIVAEFSDFGCPFCGLAAESMLPFLAQQPDVSVYFYPFPLDSKCNPAVPREVHRNSCDWTKAAICANKQNLLWPFHDRIFKMARELGELPSLFPAVEDFGLNTGELKKCFEQPETAEELREIVEVGRKIQISSTPSFFIAGRRYEGLIAMPLVTRLLEELRK